MNEIEEKDDVIPLISLIPLIPAQVIEAPSTLMTQSFSSK